jgi:hypothetical protein
MKILFSHFEQKTKDIKNKIRRCCIPLILAPFRLQKAQNDAQIVRILKVERNIFSQLLYTL